MKFTNKQILHIAWPILVSLLMEHLIGMTDTAFLGRVGKIELGASALAGVYYLAIFMLGFGFSMGVQIMVARRNGEGRYGEIGAIFSQGALFQICLAAIMFFLSQTCSPFILRAIIQSDQVYEATLSYINWRVYGFFFSFLALQFRAFYVGIADTRTLTANSLVMVGSNVVLNYVLIFGKMGFPALGIAGAAIASSIAELISLLFFVIYTYIHIDRKKYNMFRRFHFEPGLLRKIFNISIWTMMQAFISISTWFLFFISVEHLGEDQLAITNVLRSISSLFFIIVSAFATTASTLTSNLMGLGRQEQIIRMCWQVARTCYWFVIPLMIVAGLFPTLAMQIYTDDFTLISDATSAYYVMLAVYLLSVPANILFNAMSGTGNTRSALLIELVALSVYVLSVLWLVTWLRSPIAICWCTEYVYLFAMFFLAYRYMKRGNWKQKKI